MDTTPRTRPNRAFVVSMTAALAAGLAGVGCNETAPPSSSPPGQLTQSPAAPAPTRVPANAPVGAQPPAAVARAAQPASGGQLPTAVGSAAQSQRPAARQATPVAAPAAVPASPAIPAGAKWTIYCFAVQGVDHVGESIKMRDSLAALTRRNDWYLIHGHAESNLYFGFYTFEGPGDPKARPEVERGNADLKFVKEVRDLSGTTPFHNCVFVSLEAPDPTAPPEWNLFNVDRGLAPKDPRRAYWSLQVMAFRGHPLRKEAAIEAVKFIREKFKVDAYYYHGESVSSVCVGAWPASAVKAQKKADGAKVGADAVPIVTPDYVPQTAKPRSFDGKPGVVMSGELDIIDPSLKAMMEKFPQHETNYESKVAKAADGREVPMEPSFLVEIPRAKGNGLYDSEPTAATTGNLLNGQPFRYERPSMIAPREQGDRRFGNYK